MEDPYNEVWIQHLSDDLTDEQREQIKETCFEEVFQSCLQDRSYMRGIVHGYMANMTLLEQACEIAGGERSTTTEVLGFDVVTGESE